MDLRRAKPARPVKSLVVALLVVAAVVALVVALVPGAGRRGTGGRVRGTGSAGAAGDVLGSGSTGSAGRGTGGTVPEGSPTTTTVPATLTLAGCPPPPAPPSSAPPAPPSHPAVLVPESALPAPPWPTLRVHDLSAISGKGMWIWQWSQTEGADAAAVVARARAAGLHQLWVRVADSFDGFYGAAELDALVPAAHRAGLAVIGWGFPYLYDPVGDAGWTRAALDWRGPGGAELDGFSADIEMATEGVALSARRVTVYLALARQAAAGRPFVGTVYPPTDRLWATYPYASIAPYVDAFAPMVYWSCTQPAAAVQQAIARLATLAPVAPIGQAFSTAGTPGERAGAPSAAEITQFLAVARADGAVGASFWSWQAADAEQWAAIGAYPWPLAPVPVGAHPGTG